MRLSGTAADVSVSCNATASAKRMLFTTAAFSGPAYAAISTTCCLLTLSIDLHPICDAAQWFSKTSRRQAVGA